jgi:dipeptidyl aminopeptidase/acylaminoacyl peptidase
MLMFIGKEDKRVPPGAAIFYYKKLKQGGLDVRLIEYPTQGHRLLAPKYVFDKDLNVVNYFLQD